MSVIECRKHGYETWDHASHDARVVGRKNRRQGEHCSVYKCKHCHKWHVGGGIDALAYRPKHKRRGQRVTIDD
jgi:hypothetical protein